MEPDPCASEAQFQLKTVIEDMIRKCSSIGVSFNSPQRRRLSSADFASPAPGSRRQSVVVGTPLGDKVSQRELKELREKLEKTNDELHDALVMHDEVLTEIGEKNKTIDQLNFHIRDMEGTVERFNAAQDEMDELRAIEATFSKMEPQFQQCKEELSAAQSKLTDLQSLQKDFVTLSHTSKEDTAKLAALDTRVKEYRVGLKQAELKLGQERASNSRKDSEIDRLARARDEATTEVDRLKTQLDSQKLQAIRDGAESAQAVAAGSAVQDDDRNELLAQVAALKEENTVLRFSEDKQMLQSARDDLDDALSVKAETERQFSDQMVQRDQQLQDMTAAMKDVECQLAAEAEAGATGRDELAAARHRINQLQAELHSTRRDARSMEREFDENRRIAEELDALNASMARNNAPVRRSLISTEAFSPRHNAPF